MSPEKEYLAWRRGPRVGCVFARLIAGEPGRFDQKVLRVAAAGTPARVAKRIAKVIEKIVQDRAASSVALVFADLTSLEATAKVMMALNAEPLWQARTSTLAAPPPGNTVAIHITREIAFGAGVCPSEALVMGPFDEFPPTRRSPVTAMEIYIGEPRPRGPLDDADTTKANLAHIELNLATHEMFLKMWDSSKAGRDRELGGPDNRAKAKVSLVIPRAMAIVLGCAP